MNLSEILDSRYHYFLAVTSVGSFHKASESIFVSQPAVSQRIKQLEKGLGVSLLERGGGSVGLTPQGKVLYDSLLECQGILEAAFQKIERLHTQAVPRGLLRLGTLSNWDLDRLGNGFFTRFFQQHPEVEPRIVRSAPQEITVQLQTGALDVAVLPKREIETCLGVNWIRLGRAPFMLVLSRTHPLASCEDISDRLDELTLYTHQKNGKRAVLSRFEKTARRPRIVVTSNIESKIAAAESGLGGAVVLSCSKAVADPTMKAYPLEGLESELVVAFKPGNENPVVSALLRQVSELRDDIGKHNDLP